MDPKHITRTSFCNKEIDNVTDNSMKKYILDNLSLKTKINYNYRYAKIYNEQLKDVAVNELVDTCCTKWPGDLI